MYHLGVGLRGWARKLVQFLLLGLVLVLIACASGDTSPPAITPTSTHMPVPAAVPSATPLLVAVVEASVEPKAQSPAAEAEPPSQVSGAPIHPLLAWALAGDGSLLVLDATHSLYQLAPGTLVPLARSAPLVPAVGSDAERSPVTPRSAASLAMDDTRLFVSGGVLTQTLVLDRDTFEPLAALGESGVVAVEPGGHLFVIGDDPPLYMETPSLVPTLWAYELDDLSLAPTWVISPTAFGSPRDISVVPETSRLYVHWYSKPGSRHSASVVIYSTDPLSSTGCLCDPGPGFHYVGRPAIAPRGDRAVAVVHRSGYDYVSAVLLFDQEGELLAEAQGLTGLPATDADGEWIYLLQDRGLWVLRGDDLALQSVLPFTAEPPADLLLSPDGQTLYLIGNGWLTTLPVEELRALGIPAVAPLPSAWGEAIRYAPSGIEAGGVQFADFGMELYRSEDGGRIWKLLPAFTYPQFVEVTAISISPDYAQDRTLVVRSRDKLYRSTDGGETLEEWTPRVAFTSERDGNREIYTMDPDGRNKRRVTADPASDEVPAWSPAWTRVAFQSDRGGNWDIYSIRADCDPAQPDAEARCDLRQLTGDPGDDMLPAWSPDGRTIAFVSTRDGNPEIYLMQSDGRYPYRLTENQFGDWRPAWLSDNERLVFTSDRSGNNDLYLAEPPNAVRSFPDQAWLPMLENLAEQLTTDLADDRDPATATAANVLFLSDRGGTMSTHELHLAYTQNFVYPRGAAGQVDSHPSWDAFGDRFFVVREEDGAWDIYKISYDDSIRLTNSEYFEGHPAGSPVWWEPEPSESP